jgi:hypothetical protein
MIRCPPQIDRPFLLLFWFSPPACHGFFLSREYKRFVIALSQIAAKISSFHLNYMLPDFQKQMRKTAVARTGFLNQANKDAL